MTTVTLEHTGTSSVTHLVRPARNKVLTVAELARIAEDTRQAGHKVVLCHGVFDLLHMGHIRHLEAARREGDMLLVTLTADRFVNKGPGRPVFPEQLRAEMVAAIEYVDWVGISEAPSAEAVLETIRPDVYVKGSDYKAAESDITGKIVSEQETVESYGGRLVYTEDITFSSSNLINKHLSVYEPTLNQYLQQMRDGGALERLIGVIEKVRNLRVLFVGDAIVDEYQYVSPIGKSPKENMIATLFQSKELFAGGVFAAANHVASFCREVEIVTCLGLDDSCEEEILNSLKPNVKLTSLHRPGIPTTRKSRFIDTSYTTRKLFEVYFMDDSPLPAGMTAELRRVLLERLDHYDVVVVTDFGHGLLGADIIPLLCDKAAFLAVNTQSNSANYGYNLITKYPRADYVCIDGPEARLAVRQKHGELSAIAGELLPDAIACPRIIVTQGKHGCLVHEAGSPLHRVPALTNTIVDTVGAGDAFFAVTAPMVAAGADMSDIGFLGNAAGALKVGIVGHRSSVEKVSFVKFLTALLK
jgi:rfaE bifunctional protein nucleotidyltransferase chain/domain